MSSDTLPGERDVLSGITALSRGYAPRIGSCVLETLMRKVEAALLVFRIPDGEKPWCVEVEAQDSYDGFSSSYLDHEEAKQLRDLLNEFLLTGPRSSNE